MTKDGYVLWLRTRGEPGTWNVAKCRAADKLIRETTLASFKKYMAQYPEPLRTFTVNIVSAYFGSADVDDLLMKLKLYPDWM